MSKNTSGPSFALVLFHVIMVMITGTFWLIPLAIYYGIKFVNKK